LCSAGYEVVDAAERVDVVVVSFDYRKLKIVFVGVNATARIVAIKPDAYCPTPTGGLPDYAAMLAAVEASTGIYAKAMIGKPSQHMASALLDRLGVPARDTLLIGDRLATDVRMPTRLA
jgi:NagD protein